jgi:L-fuculose-phosphate aldolase
MLEKLKEKVVKIAKEADKSGMCKHKSGNFSIRDEKTGYVVITPSGVSREILAPEHISVVDLDDNVIEMKTEYKPSSEILMHLEIYKTRQDVMAVAHTHSRFATAFSVLGKEIPPIIYECNNCSKNGRIPVAPYGRPGTQVLAQNVADTLKYSDVCLMESHGAIAVGNDIEDAFLKAQYLEEIAEIYYITLTLNNLKEPNILPKEELEKWKYPSEVKFKTM